MNRQLLSIIPLALLFVATCGIARPTAAAPRPAARHLVLGDSLSTDSLPTRTVGPDTVASGPDSTRRVFPGMIVLGLAFADSTPHAPLFHASLAYRRGDFILTGRLTRGSESFWDIDLLSLIGLEELAIDEIEDRPTRGIWELGVMGGICLGRPRTFLTLSAGLGWVHHIDRGRHIGRECVGSYSGSTADCYEQYESVTASSLGLALEANLIVSTSDLAGIGVNIFVNLNDTLPFYGAGVALYSGLVPAP